MLPPTLVDGVADFDSINFACPTLSACRMSFDIVHIVALTGMVFIGVVFIEVVFIGIGFTQIPTSYQQIKKYFCNGFVIQ